MGNLLEFKDISKAFVGVQALDSISFTAEGGEVTALLGENGAGKSTLLKILSGAYIADSGDYFINGKKMDFKNPYEGIKAGVSIIYQERQLVPTLSVTENVFMEELPHGFGGLVNYREAHKETAELIKKFGLPFTPTTIVKDLSVAYQQMVEIMKAYRRDSMIIAFDEPTAPLSDAEIDILFDLILQLKQEGKIILYVSHRLAELFRITDKIVIFKDGKHVEDIRTVDADERYLVTKMVGRDIGDTYKNVQHNENIGDVILEAKGLTGGIVDNVSFQLRAGEVLGFAGLVGAGRSETMQLIFGADPIESGEIYMEGKKLKIKGPADAIKAGIGLAPEDRKIQGLVLRRPIRDNISLPSMRKVSGKTGFINFSAERRMANDAIEKYRIKTHSAEKIAGELSGGNQQKIILGRWMAADLKVLILDEPTKGIDVGAKAEIYQMVCDLARQGLGVIFISSELTEVINICDRVIVMHEGAVTGTLNRDELSEESILALAMKEI